MEPPTQEQIANIVKSAHDGKSASYSSIRYNHIKFLCNKRRFIPVLERLFKELMEDPGTVTDAANLYSFQLLYLPKGTKFRPICIEETIIQILHKHIASNLRLQNPLHEQ